MAALCSVRQMRQNAKDLMLFFEIHTFETYLIVFRDWMYQMPLSGPERQLSYKARGQCLHTIRSYPIM